MEKYNGTVTVDVNEFIELDRFADEVSIERNILRENNSKLRELLLPRLYRSYSMGYNSREDMVKIKDDGTPGYDFGFMHDDVKDLQSAGITLQELIAYIHAQWDTKETKSILNAKDEVEE